METQGSDLASLLAALRDGTTVEPGRLALLSDLSTADYEQVRGAWLTIAGETRCMVLADAGDLAENNSEFNFDRLARIGMTDPDPVVRGLSIETTWESTDHRIASDLTRLVASDPESQVRFAAAESLGRFVLSRELEEFDAKQGDEIIQVLRQRFSDVEEAPEVRARALASIAYSSAPWVDALINEAYYDENRLLRLASIEAMGNTSEDRWAEYIDEQLLSEDPEFRFQAVASAGEIAAIESVDAVAALLDDEDEDVSLAAVVSLGEIGGEDALAYLKDFKERMPEDFAEALDVAIDAASNPWRSDDGDGEWEQEDDE
ncbi:hypothetical protein AYO38_01170 [bacterium SCGC AG-212-C10]|nr:hypothetical protein AYO38_01170 [bacterium SCGC AG-212-C10]